MTKLIDSVNSPDDLRNIPVQQLDQLAVEIREYITRSVAKTGGHLASNLGVVELTIAMHRAFDFSHDHLIWDVGHQCYAHKILTCRRNNFDKLRKKDGLSGFPDPQESPYDRFKVGHAGTAIPTAIGMALAAQQNKTTEKIVALVGDASIVNGASFEGLNNLNLVKRQMLIVLNDNSMAIDVTQGGIANFLSKVRLNHTYEDIRRTTKNILTHLPLVGEKMDHAFESFKKTLRMAITPNRLFESLNIPYFGPVDGHDIPTLIELFNALSHLNTPAILHVYTKKGKGFTPADDNPCKFHSTGPFKINGDSAAMPAAGKKFTNAFSDAIVELAKNDDRVVVITAAMPDGTGLIKFRENFPNRYYDVGIAESAAVDIAAGLAKKGLRPFVCIYSTFLQRSFDQIFQEVALADLPVTLCIDRCGPVGDDGPTHHGMFDIAYTRPLPNMNLIAPADQKEMALALNFIASRNKPAALRYPRDVIPENDRLHPACDQPFQLGKSVWIKNTGADTVIVALGSLLSHALTASDILSAQGFEVDIINARFVKPLDPMIVNLVFEDKNIITVEDHARACGFGSALNEAVVQRARNLDLEAPKIDKIVNLAAPDTFIPPDTRANQLCKIGVDPESIAQAAIELAHKYSKPHVEDIC